MKVKKLGVSEPYHTCNLNFFCVKFYNTYLSAYKVYLINQNKNKEKL